MKKTRRENKIKMASIRMKRKRKIIKGKRRGSKRSERKGKINAKWKMRKQEK